MSIVSNRPARVKAPARPKQPPPRTIRLVEPPEQWLNEGEGKLEITQGPLVTQYAFREFASQLPGRAFHVRKVRTFNTRTLTEVAYDEEYDVRVHTPADCNCGCLGFERWGHCKHVTELAGLIAAGRLPCRSLSSMAKHQPEEYRRTMNATAMFNTPRAKDAYVLAELAAMDDDGPDSAA